MKIALCALDDALFRAWEEAFADVEDARIVRGSILDQRADAIVSPANSFGYMDGGLDLVYSEFFGWDLEARVRERVLADHLGELPVGQAIVVPTDHARFRWLISAPTMRVPANVAETANAMLAFRAVLAAAAAHNAAHPSDPIGSIAVPGLCTGEGRMPPERCARQMRYAWRVAIEGHRERLGGSRARSATTCSCSGRSVRTRNHVRLAADRRNRPCGG